MLFFSPETAGYIERLERERDEKERGEVKDNRSILAKYVSYKWKFVHLF